MKLVIAVAIATTLGIVVAAPAACFAQAADSEAEAPALRADDSAPAAAPAPAAPVSPAAQLADARAAALAAAALPGATSDPLIANVADYALFQRDLDAVAERAIEEPQDLDAIMDTLAGYDAATLPDAFYSYGAFIAAQQPAFVDKVREVAEFYGVDQLVQGMLNEPEYVLTFDGAREAADMVLNVVRQDAAEIGAISGRFKQASYDLQTQGWSNLIAEDRPERLDSLALPQRITTPSQQMLAEVAFGAPISASDAAAGQRRAAFWSAVDYRPAPARVTLQPANRGAEAIGVMMTLAALRTLNVSQTRPDLVTRLLDLPTAKDCLDFSQLHMAQCVAAAHFKYEDAFCIAEHQLLDASQCLAETVDAPPAIAPATPQIAQTAAEAPLAASSAPAAEDAAADAPAPAETAAEEDADTSPRRVGVSADEVLGITRPETATN